MSGMSVYSLIMLCTQQLEDFSSVVPQITAPFLFFSPSGTLIFFRKINVQSLLFIATLSFLSSFVYFFYLQWMLLKSVPITNWSSCSVKSLLFWLGCEFKFHYYTFISLDVFLFSLSATFFFIWSNISSLLSSQSVFFSSCLFSSCYNLYIIFLENNQCFLSKSCLHKM